LVYYVEAAEYDSNSANLVIPPPPREPARANPFLPSAPGPSQENRVVDAIGKSIRLVINARFVPFPNYARVIALWPRDVARSNGTIPAWIFAKNLTLRRSSWNLASEPPAFAELTLRRASEQTICSRRSGYLISRNYTRH